MLRIVEVHTSYHQRRYGNHSLLTVMVVVVLSNVEPSVQISLLLRYHHSR